MAKLCKHCGSTDHTKFYCRTAPRPTITRKKRMNLYGKHAYLWWETRKRWIATHGSKHYCHYCGVPLTDNDELLANDPRLRKLTLDHITARSAAPELRYEESNLVPSCEPCNMKKSSRSHDAYTHVCHTALPALPDIDALPSKELGNLEPA